MDRKRLSVRVQSCRARQRHGRPPRDPLGFRLVDQGGNRIDAEDVESPLGERVREPTFAAAEIEDGARLGDLDSRREVGEILRKSGVPTAELRAAVIIGSGSASFEMIRHLTERLPVMVTPTWVRTRCQPIGVRSVLEYLVEALDHPTARGIYEIGALAALAEAVDGIDVNDLIVAPRLLGAPPPVRPHPRPPAAPPPDAGSDDAGEPAP